MNIFYYSVHHILEDDEVRMLKSLGHSVFRLGTWNRNVSTGSWRPDIINTDAEERIYDIYESLGGRYSAARSDDELIPPSFLDHFSVAIIMHSADFITCHWTKLSRSKVVWRTIGQGVDAYEDMLRPFRNRGLHIVRYSDVEKTVPGYLGQDAVIRFCKRADSFGAWNPVRTEILTFSNLFKQRYPNEAADYLHVAQNIPCVLGGEGNDTFAESIGLLSAEDQIDRYQSCAGYLYCTGLEIPYTLNFMEAWLTGMPIIVYAPNERKGRYYEIDKLVQDCKSGLICRTVEEVISAGKKILSDIVFARNIGAAGHARAMELFSEDIVAPQWQSLLDKIT